MQISATASNGYHFAQWSDGNTDNPRTITVTGDATYIATFAPNNYTIVVRSLNEDWGTVSEGGTFPYGTEIQISATPRENYAFVAWTDGNTDNPRTITVVADAEYTAAFTWSVGIDETAVSEIALFPNPATDILNITTSETISEIEIVNTLGQVVKRIEVNSDNAVCDVEELKAGVYVVRIRTASATLSQRKFIKE
ncbi:MAG: T9SS type A sorting domain-containing protein [Bacteroidales bacterium]|nr:T9SS type A sorting domain-containing protein [Bacteroidales bacterium]